MSYAKLKPILLLIVILCQGITILIQQGTIHKYKQACENWKKSDEMNKKTIRIYEGMFSK